MQLLLSISCAFSLASSLTIAASSKPLPLLIWHGLGDRYDNDGLHSVGELANATNAGTYVYYIRTDDNSDNDRSNTFFGNVTAQIEDVCETLATDPKLFDPTTKSIRVDALGFSQGGQFLRGLVQTCPALSVRSLVTFGSQHNGISDIKVCTTWDFLCKGAVALMKGNVWSASVQDKVVPAQYFRTVDEETGLGSDEYLENSVWLASANNERKKKRKATAKRVSQLENFVMFVFANDTTVIPKESGWFAEVINGTAIDLRRRPIYTEDWLGLKALDKKGGLVFASTPGDHMQLDDDILIDTFERYFGPEKSSHAATDHLQSLLESPSSWWMCRPRVPDRHADKQSL